MAQVNISVQGRSYLLACDDGEEAHLQDLAAGLDARISELGQTVGPAGEARTFLMTSLVLSDELAAQTDRMSALETENAALRGGGSAEARARLEQSELSIALVLESAARRIEDLVKRLS